MKIYEGQSVRSATMSEKFDGVQATWDGRTLKTRTGGRIHAPAWWTVYLPNCRLVGELFGGRGKFDQTRGIVMSKTPDDRWTGIRLMVFRGEADSKYCQTVEQIPVRSGKHLDEFYQAIVEQGGEGVVVRIGSESYKRKPIDDTEGVVIEHIEGKGKYAGLLGAVMVRLRSGQMFKIGSGFTDSEREHPPAIGSVVKFEYEGVTSGGLPRFARFAGIRAEVDLNF